MEEAEAEITGDGVAEEDEETLDRRPVQPHVVTQRRDLLRGGLLARQHHLDRVSGRQPHHQEDDDADAEQDRYELQQPGGDRGGFHRARVPFSSRRRRGG